MEMRPEELLQHRGRDAVAPTRRQRVQYRDRIEVTLMITGEDHGAIQTLEPVETSHFGPHIEAQRWKDPGRQAEPPHGTNGSAPGPRREATRRRRLCCAQGRRRRFP